MTALTAAGTVHEEEIPDDLFAMLGVVPENDAEKARPAGRAGLDVVPENDAEKARPAGRAGLDVVRENDAEKARPAGRAGLGDVPHNEETPWSAGHGELPVDAPAAQTFATEALFATLPKLPSIEGFSQRLAQIQASLQEAQVEADSLRAEIQRKALALRALAGALEAAI